MILGRFDSFCSVLTRSVIMVLVELKNISAFYFPGRQYNVLNDSITNVNTFRVVMSEYFNYKLPLLKDTSFYMLLR